MLELLAAVLLIVVVWLVLLTAAVGAGLWALGRHNRVSTQHPSPAPLSWVWSPKAAARLHRRLRTAVGWVEGPETGAGAGDVQRRLVDEAVTVDHHLVRAAGAPRSHRRRLLREAGAQVTEVERLAVRVHRLDRPSGVPASGRAPAPPDVAANLAALREQLDLLDAAHAELEDLERHAGLGDPPDLPDPAPVPRSVTVDGEPVDAEVVTRPQPRPHPRPGT